MKEYRNAQRTKKWIREAFTKLLAEKHSIEKITVADLVKEADISKTTFYYHYRDISSVAQEFEDELTAALFTAIDNAYGKDPSDYAIYIKNLAEFFKDNEKTYSLVINSFTARFFMEKLKHKMKQEFANKADFFPFSQEKGKREVQISFIANACADVVEDYMKGELSCSLDSIAEQLIETMNKLLSN